MKIALGCILFSFVALSIGSALSESLTYDEVFYLEEGRRIVATRTFSDPYNPPLAPMLTAIPKLGRLVTVGLGMLLVLAVYRVGGPVAALFLAFDPTLLAHSHYGTNDVAVTLFIFLSTIAWIRFMRNPSRWRALLLGLAAGYALASKITAIPYLTVTFAVCWWWKRSRRRWTWFVRHGLMLFASATVALFVLWASYLFTWDVLIREREDPSRVSTRLVAYAKEHNLPALEPAMMFFRQQPLPLGTYAATIKNNILRMGKPSIIFFDGAIYDRSRWYFMLVNFLRKTPIPFFIMVGIGLWYELKIYRGLDPRLRGDDKIWRFVGMALTSSMGMILFASFIGMVPLVRYVLPAMPFLALVGASGVREIGEISPTSLKLRGVKGMIIVGLLLWYIGGTIVQYPHFISYANELAGPRAKRYEILADSNLDWGQALPDLVLYVKDRQIGKVRFSYFGRDDASLYGLPSKTLYGSWRFEEICAFHDVILDANTKEKRTVISVSNWYYCGYNKEGAYKKEKIRDVVADVFLVFD